MQLHYTTSYRLLLAVIILTMGACKDDYNLPPQPLDIYVRLYMPQAVNGAVVKTLKITDSLQAVVYGANLGGLTAAENDIAVNFAVDNTKIDSFNKANNTQYPPLPDGSYSLSAASATITKGSVSTAPLSILFKTNGAGAMDALKAYLLPVSITGNKFPVNEALRTSFFVVKAQPDLKDYPPFDRTHWQLIDFSSQEANGEGANNGRAVFVLDNNNSTFWHTQWQGASPGPPHYLTIDMGTTKTLHGVAFLSRQNDNSGKPNEVTIQVSTDNITWTDAGTFNLQNNKELQSPFLPNGFKSARYVKVIVNSSYNASFAHLAELFAF